MHRDRSAPYLYPHLVDLGDVGCNLYPDLVDLGDVGSRAFDPELARRSWDGLEPPVSKVGKLRPRRWSLDRNYISLNTVMAPSDMLQSAPIMRLMV